MKYTENLLLELHNTTTDKSLPVITWRSSINGETDSAFIKIDKAFGELKEQMTKVSGSAIKVEATGDGLGNYSAINIDKIEEYKKDDVIALIPSVDCIGNSMLNINSLGNKSLMKVANDGTLVVLEKGDLRANHEYYFRYNGSMFVWQIGTSAEQLNYCATEDSTLEATNVKDAIEELDVKLEILNKTRGYHTPQLQTNANELVDSGKYVGFGDNLPDDGVWMVDVTASHRTYIDDITSKEITDIYIVQQAYKVCDTVGNRVEPIGKTRTCINDNWSTWNEVVLDDGKFDCIPDITVQGRTLVNLLGRAGNAIYQQDWTVFNTSITYTNDTFVFSGDGSISKDINTISGNSYLVGYIRNGVYENNIIVASATTTTVSISVSDGDILSYIRAYQIENTETLEDCTNEKYPYVDDVKCVVNPYFECDNSRIMFETKLYDGETISRRNDGIYVKNSEWGEFEINANCNFFTSPTVETLPDGQKAHSIAILDITKKKHSNDAATQDTNDVLVFFDGINYYPLQNRYWHWGGTGGDNGDAYYLYLYLPITLTGWGENYIPTQEEIKAFFLGWRMYGAFGDTSDLVYWSDSDSQNHIKGWLKLYSGIGGKFNLISGQVVSSYIGGSNVYDCPTVMNDQGYTPYRLIYKKETPTIEEVKTYGGLVIKDGVDIISSSGLVLDEKIEMFRNPYHTRGGKDRIKSEFYRVQEFLNGRTENGEIVSFTSSIYDASGQIKVGLPTFTPINHDNMQDYLYIDYLIYKPDTVTSYDYTLTYDNSIKSILNNTQNELIATKEELANTKKELERTKYELSQRSNPNLLINGDFQVWQRGENITVKSMKYGCDRWCGYYDSTMTKTTKGLKFQVLKGTYATITPYIRQIFEVKPSMLNKSFALSINIISLGTLAEGEMYVTVKNFTKNTELSTFYRLKAGINYIYGNFRNFDLTDNIGVAIGSVTVAKDVEFELGWVKLELGSVATPFVPRSYGEELLACQRYYEKGRVRRMAITTWHLSDTILQLKTQKRIKPTFKLKGDQSGIENVIDVLDEASIVESNINANKITFTSVTNDYSQYMIGSDTNCFTPNKRIGFIYEADAEIY